MLNIITHFETTSISSDNSLAHVIYFMSLVRAIILES